MIVYGRNAVREALRGSREVRRVWATQSAAREPWLGEGPLGGAGTELLRAGAAEVAERCGSDGHQGVCAEVSEFRYAGPAGLLAAGDPLLVVLDEVQDPQNLGAICRTADAAGATGVLIAERRAARVTAAVCKASAGAVEHVPVARVANVADLLGEARAAGIWCYGAAVEGELAWDGVDWRGGAAIVLGAEGRGLRPRVAASCDALVALPLRGRVASLNVSAAAAALLYEAARQRGA